MQTLRATLTRNADLAIIVLVLGILTVLFVPIPAGALDFLILANVSFSMLILLLTFYIARPVEFSTFPSLLLIATLFRLSRANGRWRRSPERCATATSMVAARSTARVSASSMRWRCSCSSATPSS